MQIVYKTCPLCFQEYYLELDPEEAERYARYRAGEGLVQTMLPSLNPVEREFLMTGYCPHCQGELFLNSKTDRIFKS